MSYVVDCEVYNNYFLVIALEVESGKIQIIQTKSKLSNSDKLALAKIMENVLIGFNILKYDILILCAALKDFDVKDIYKLSTAIIGNTQTTYELNKNLNLGIFNYSIIDMFTILNQIVSLKAYGARIHADTIINLPYDPQMALDDESITTLIEYCKNDIKLTYDLYKLKEKEVELRYELSKKYGKLVLYKSDSQIAETIMRSELYNKQDSKPSPGILRYQYEQPNFIKFKSQLYNNVLNQVKSCQFNFNHTSGIVPIPLAFNGSINKLTAPYTLGIGGLHSTETNKLYVTDKEYMIIDADVQSYYPSIIVICQKYPQLLGVKFLDTYNQILKERIKAKIDGDKIKSETLKIVVNGTFGKFGNKFSIMYSPDLMLFVTLTGQLALLMLIEDLTINNIEVVSCNTDGITCRVKRVDLDKYHLICNLWQLNTGFNLEKNIYIKMFIINVNNYFALIDNKEFSFKTKGVFAESGLTKIPGGEIIYQAVMNYIIKGIEIENTVKHSTDIRDYIFVRKVDGGGSWKGKEVGKVVRWIRSLKGEAIIYTRNGNKVANSDNAWYIETISNESKWKEHIDYNYYINEARAIVSSVLGELQ